MMKPTIGRAAILAHGVHLSEPQVRHAEQLGCWLVQNPRSNRGNRVGYPAALRASARVALGTDGYASDLEAERAALLDDALRYAAAHRSAFMWPWEQTPLSIAEGILDDETYDWVAVLRGMAATGGTTVVADEETLKEANRIAREATGIAVSHTGSAGLAGLLQLHREGVIATGARVGVLFSGVQR